MYLYTFDLGGSAVKHGLAELNNNHYKLLSKDSFPTPYTSADHLISMMLSEIEHCDKNGELSGIAVSTPGSVDDPIQGIIKRGGKLQYLDKVPFGRLISNASGLPCSVENDGRCGLLGEYMEGALRGCSSGAVIVLGTSVGGGIIINGNVLPGFHNFAGKFAHIISNYDKEENSLHHFGWENGREALKNLVLKHKQLPSDTRLNGFEIFDMAEQHDRQVLAALKEFCLSLAIQIFNIQIIFDPEIIVIAGGISSRNLLLELIQEQLEKIYSSYPLPLPKANVRLAKLGNDANLIGACKSWSSSFAPNFCLERKD